ncbi:Alpha/Beta hydrolase protein [Baffinella frigidus]|nr:Alpha/Beta hydrolase protein [Cryptophyta sp. CCMP2293]
MTVGGEGGVQFTLFSSEGAMTARPLVLVIHAFGGSPKKFWYPWLASSLEGHCDVQLLSTRGPPEEVAARVEDLAASAASAAAGAEEAEPRVLFLIGHSVGCQTIIRFLSLPSTTSLLFPSPPSSPRLKLGGCLCVAAWFAIVDPWAAIAPWCTEPIDDAAVRATLGRAGAPLRVLLSDNDRYSPDFAAEGAAWLVRFGSGAAGAAVTVEVVHGRSHFGGKRQQEVLDAALSLLG